MNVYMVANPIRFTYGSYGVQVATNVMEWRIDELLTEQQHEDQEPVETLLRISHGQVGGRGVGKGQDEWEIIDRSELPSEYHWQLDNFYDDEIAEAERNNQTAQVNQ